jgi:uncharacterized protein (DUF2267 family)
MKTHAVVREVANRLGCDERRADGLTFTVFQELRDRLTPKEAADVAAQLPAPLRHMWLEGESPDRGVARTHREEFLGNVRRHAALADDAEAERAVQAVFAALQNALGSPHGIEGEAWDVFSQLPKDLKHLWLTAHDPGARGPMSNP